MRRILWILRSLKERLISLRARTRIIKRLKNIAPEISARATLGCYPQCKRSCAVNSTRQGCGGTQKAAAPIRSDDFWNSNFYLHSREVLRYWDSVHFSEEPRTLESAGSHTLA